MTKIRMLRSKVISQLRADIGVNLAAYRNGDFSWLVEDTASWFELEDHISHELLAEVRIGNKDNNEVFCCGKLLAALPTISAYLARDERLWVYLTHTHLLQYGRTRWPIPKGDEEAVSHIRKHFFVSGTRGVERDNAASRLWWMASLCSRVKTLTLAESLTAFLHSSDVRANIIERPTLSQSPDVFAALVLSLHASLQGDRQLLERARFRSVMKSLNLRAGVQLVESLDERHVRSLVEECAN